MRDTTARFRTGLFPLRESLREFLCSRFARNLAAVTLGTATAQAIGIGFAPFVTRLYGPEAFGLLGTFTALAAIIAPLAALSYPLAMVLPEREEDALGVAQLSLFVALSVTAGSIILLLLGENWIVKTFFLQPFRPLIWFLPPVVLFSALHQIFEQWLIRRRQFSIIARVATCQALLLGVVKIGIGWYLPASSVLVAIAAFGSGLHVCWLALGVKKARKSEADEAIRLISGRHCASVARRFSDFPLFRTPQVFINAVSHGLPIMMLSAFFGPGSAGFYALSVTLMSLPIAVVGKAFGDVLSPCLAEAAQRREILRPLLLKSTLALTAAGLVPFTLTVVFGPRMFEIAFGQEWSEAGRYAQYLAPFFFFQLINRPAVAAIPVLGLQKGLMIYEICSTGSKLLALYIGFRIFQSPEVSIGAFSLFGTVAYTILITWVLYLSGTKTGR